jgi:hypothetical protein
LALLRFYAVYRALVRAGLIEPGARRRSHLAVGGHLAARDLPDGLPEGCVAVLAFRRAHEAARRFAR